MAFGQWLQAGLGDSSKKNTIAVLDGVRAFACLFVILYHIDVVPYDFHVWNVLRSVPALLAAFLYFGKYGVTLFFVLSGFLLFMPYAKALLFEQTWPSTRRFYLRRVFRILPAYYLSLILIVLLFQRQYLQPQHLGELGLFFAFLMDSSKTTFKQLNAPFWTLAIEWQYYMFLPLLVLGMRLLVWRVKQNNRLSATIACILALIAWGVFTRCVGDYLVYQHPAATLLVPRSALNVVLLVIYGVDGKFLEDFGVGMLLSLCFIYAQHPSVSAKISATLQKLSPYFWGAGLLSLCTLILWNYNKVQATWAFFTQPLLFANYYRVNELGYALSFGLCILALLFGQTWLKWPFVWLPVRWTGMISFSLYMWHFPLLVVFINWVQPLLRGWPLALNYSAYWLWVLMVIIPFCFLFYKWVEKPGMNFGERFTRQKMNIAAPQKVNAEAPSARPATSAAGTTHPPEQRELVAGKAPSVH